MLISTGVFTGYWLIQSDEKRIGPATTLIGAVALSFVIPSDARDLRFPRTFRGNVLRQSIAK
ncbi:MAG: hypothetical protein QOH35_3156 [Acidobacteriaceae bacterium]|jgi:hypothetical protein|nr:hypothetical protein [Acidobacteriaceae bacterium]